MTTARRRYMARLRAERAEVMAQRRPVVDPGRHPHLHALAQALRAIPSHRRKDDQHRVTVHIGPGRGRTDLLSQQDDEDRHRDYAIKSTQIAPGHTRIQFGSHYRVGRGQHHPSAGQGGASSLVTVYE